MYECRLRFEVAYEMENVWYEVYSMAEEEKKQGFEKKDIIYSESLGVCKVDDVVKLSQKKGEGILYYVLRSVTDKKKVAYIPVEKHEVQLRSLIDQETAKQLKADGYKELSAQRKQEVDYVLDAEHKKKK